MLQARRIAQQQTTVVASEQLFEKPLVSVAFVCFNHANYVKQALDSVLSQKVDFDFEVVIADDASIDGTAEIAKEYQTLFPRHIVLLLANENMGKHSGTGMINLVRCFDQCRGKYVARLEGDDNWSDPEKLQRQVNFLNSNSDCVACHHLVDVIDEKDNVISTLIYPYNKKKIGLNDLYKFDQTPVKTSAICFRRRNFPQVPEEFLNAPMLDWPLSFSLANQGRVGFIDRRMSRYRLHAGGIWSTKDLYFRARRKLITLKIIVHSLKLQDCKAQRNLFFKLRMNLAKGLAKNGQLTRANRIYTLLRLQDPFAYIVCRVKSRCNRLLNISKRFLADKWK